MLALVLGLAASLWQADRAAREAARAQNEAARAQQEADRANKALNDLQAAAPSIAADARARAAKGNFDQALEKLDYAAMLQQDAPELLVAKGDLYLCQLKLSQAAAVYRDAVRLKPGFAPAEMKANLCDRLLAASQSAQGKLDLESLAEIYSALEPEKRSATELFAVREAYADEKERLWKYWLPRLQSLPMFANILSGEDEWAWAGRFDIRNDGQLILYLGNLDPGDLSQLKDLPVADLYLAQCKNVADVQPLADMPSLENITVPALARNIEALHKPPKLKRIAFSYKAELSSDEQIRKYYQLASSTLSEAKKQEQGSNNSLDQNALLRRMQLFGIDGRWGRSTPATTAEEFWKEYPTLSWLSRLRDAAIKPIDVTRQTDGTWAVTVHDPKFTDCSFFAGSNVRRLDLDQSQVTDLSPLADLPLAALSLRETPVKDLSPLRSPTLRDSLRELRVWRTKITDFSPVAGCAKLELFDAADTQLTDLSIIKGMKLHTLLIERTSVTDLAPVAGMPLTNLDISRTRVADLSPLLKCQTLKSIILPQNAKDVGSLHGLPNLARVSYTSKGGNPDKSADEFWGSGQTEEPWIVALRKANLNFSQRRLADKSWALTLDDQPITDLSSLKGANITQLSIARTPVADLAPLRGMRLTNLKIGGSKVTDLSPIKGMALTSVQLSGTAVRDLSPLTGMPLRGLIMTSCKEITDLSPLADMASTLETVILPTNAKDIEFLRAFPNLARLSYKFDATIKGPAQTAHEFWAEYDRAKSAAP
jgi:Leucine-rich repeat (LRR) protein